MRDDVAEATAETVATVVTGVIVVVTATVDRLTVVVDTDVECGSVTAADVAGGVDILC